MSARDNLLDFDRPGLRKWLVSMGESPYRADQIIQWVHQKGVTDIDQMTNLSQSLRTALKARAEIRLPEINIHQLSNDGTQKWVLGLSCGNSIEMVFIPETTRGTLCVSSQVGCALKCTFCSTGKQGFNRDLSVGEIIGQVLLAKKTLSASAAYPNRAITNVVMMGMGEPLMNFDPVVKAMGLMMDDFAYGLSKRRVTLSTSGLIPQMKKLRELSDVSLAVSLHAPNDALRNILVPINKKYPLKELMEVCRTYFNNEKRRYVTMEYVMLAGVNDQDEHAEQLIQLLKPIPAKLNLIPFNPHPGTEYQCSSSRTIQVFQDKLISAGINTIVRKTRGDDIDAACGQLVGQVNKRQKQNRQSIPVSEVVFR